MLTVRQRDFNIVTGEVNDRITQFFFSRFLLKEIEQAIPGQIRRAIVLELEAGIQICVIPKLLFNVFFPKLEILENTFIRSEFDQRAIILLGFPDLAVIGDFTLLKLCSFLPLHPGRLLL